MSARLPSLPTLIRTFLLLSFFPRVLPRNATTGSRSPSRSVFVRVRWGLPVLVPGLTNRFLPVGSPDRSCGGVHCLFDRFWRSSERECVLLVSVVTFVFAGDLCLRQQGQRICETLRLFLRVACVCVSLCARVNEYVQECVFKCFSSVPIVCGCCIYFVLPAYPPPLFPPFRHPRSPRRSTTAATATSS